MFKDSILRADAAEANGGRNMRLDDDLGTEDRITVDGPRRGDIRAAFVQIERTGSVVGNISARIVKVAGRLEGDVDAVEFYAAKTARVRGAIRADVVGVMPGSSVAGCSFDTRRPRLAERDAPVPAASLDGAPVQPEAASASPDLGAAFARLAEQLAEVVAGSREEPKPIGQDAADVEIEKADPEPEIAAPSPAGQKRVLPKLFA